MKVIVMKLESTVSNILIIIARTYARTLALIRGLEN